ncbi:di-heme enzyme, MXAN_0977 family [Leptospira inadai serovar Lyme str. 10]|uniref:Di-heme enzyme, MXAN_0977 family n=2 Tax=Leptospira inadai serovar Lyme TaxID=293084 RepID=V6HYE5_9LEPT|nr:methanobactin export MATE transporter MbnM [Leptospira inadai]EQA38034.1 di-heme enzyme, MXAN_0977 family [Leptospira inadai serovar Lyme str. 10]PNV73359.1 di-heme enzyme [Leptospira inadai serovar Lyme]
MKYQYLFSLVLLALSCSELGIESKKKDSSLQATLLSVALLGKGGSGYAWNLPPGFPTPKVPVENPMSEEKVTLGRLLFFDKRLSANNTQSCGSCHQPSKAFTDGLTVSVGSTGQLHTRNAQHLSNIAYNVRQTWANPLLVKLEDQIPIPIFGDNPVELGMRDREEELLGRLRENSVYRALFQAAYPADSDPISLKSVVFAIASFERTLLSGDSPFDKYNAGHLNALNPSAIRGKNLFFGERAECFHCHAGFNFTDTVLHSETVFEEFAVHNNGLDSSRYQVPNGGLFEFTAKANDRGKFRAPSLRNVELTAPYMHDGSIPDLISVVNHYASGGSGDGRTNPNRDSLVRSFSLTESEKADLVEFLKSLTDPSFIQNRRFQDPF